MHIYIYVVSFIAEETEAVDSEKQNPARVFLLYKWR